MNDSRILHLSATKLTVLNITSSYAPLQVVILSNNLLSSFTSLQLCPQLFFIDLSNNQISRLPSPSFWTSFLNLRVLYLHDNKIPSLSLLSPLTSLTSLQVLRVSGNPLCSCSSYRHFLVNCIPSLLLLDDHVISDGEVINGVNFNNSPIHFLPLSPFSLFKYPRFPEVSDYLKFMKYFRQIFKLISAIQSDISPVILIQRSIRGFLIRKKVSKFLFIMNVAAIEIQRFIRGKLVRLGLKNGKIRERGEKDDVVSSVNDKNLVENLVENAKSLEKSEQVIIRRPPSKILDVLIPPLPINKEQSQNFSLNISQIIKIQALVRGFLTRLYYRKLLTTREILTRKLSISTRKSCLDTEIPEQLPFFSFYQGHVSMSKKGRIVDKKGGISTIELNQSNFHNDESDLSINVVVPPTAQKKLIADVLTREKKILAENVLIERSVGHNSRLMSAVDRRKHVLENHRKVNISGRNFKFSDSALSRLYCKPYDHDTAMSLIELEKSMIVSNNRSRVESIKNDEKKSKEVVIEKLSKRRDQIRQNFDKKFKNPYSEHSENIDTERMERVRSIKNNQRQTNSKGKNQKSALIAFSSGHSKIVNQMSRFLTQSIKQQRRDHAIENRNQILIDSEKRSKILQEYHQSNLIYKKIDLLRFRAEKSHLLEYSRKKLEYHTGLLKNEISRNKRNRQKLLKEYFREKSIFIQQTLNHE
ncbi:hypothetical protein RCL1_006293 [Eukaryota sp. TZLM3-RCL]